MLFQVGIPNLVQGLLLGWHSGDTTLGHLDLDMTSDLIYRFFVSIPLYQIT